MRSDWLSPNPIHITDTLGATKKRKMGPANKLLSKLENQKEGEIIIFDSIKLKCSKNVFSPTVTHCSEFFGNAIKANEGAKCLEVGVGSGYNLIKIGKKYTDLKIYGLDFNPIAVKIAKENLKLNNIKGEIFYSNLFQDLPKLKFDYIYFNPPLIHKEFQKIVEASIYDPAGKIISSFFNSVSDYLEKNGVIYILYTAKEYDFFEDLIKKHNFYFSEAAIKDVGYEKYTVYKIRKRII